MKKQVSRRSFLGSVVAGGALASGRRSRRLGRAVATVRSRRSAPRAVPPCSAGRRCGVLRFPSWPVADAREEDALVRVIRSGKWFRGENVVRLRSRIRQADRRQALPGHRKRHERAHHVARRARRLGPGDEVIVPPYTFVATINAVLLMRALPVFVDSDIETFQIDARKIEPAITGNTRVIMPVHLGGSAADLDTILEVSQRRGVTLVEDACQAHLAEWRGRKVGYVWQDRLLQFSGQQEPELRRGWRDPHR